MIHLPHNQAIYYAHYTKATFSCHMTNIELTDSQRSLRSISEYMGIQDHRRAKHIPVLPNSDAVGRGSSGSSAKKKPGAKIRTAAHAVMVSNAAALKRTVKRSETTVGGLGQTGCATERTNIQGRKSQDTRRSKSVDEELIGRKEGCNQADAMTTVVKEDTALKNEEERVQAESRGGGMVEDVGNKSKLESDQANYSCSGRFGGSLSSSIEFIAQQHRSSTSGLREASKKFL